MATNGINNSSSHLKVKSLEVVKSGDSKTATQLKTLWTQVYLAKSDRESLRVALESLSLDAKITVAEKVYLQTEWDTITVEHSIILQDAEDCDLLETDDYSNYVAAFNALYSYITPILATPEEDTTILQAQYNSLFDRYFSTFNGLSQLIIYTMAYTNITDELPGYDDLNNGYNYDDATTTPTTPTLTAAAVVSGIQLFLDKQISLKYLARYDFQVSEDEVNWYALGMSGDDWKTGGAGGYTSYPGESLMHLNLPAVQLAVLGTFASGTNVISIPLGTGQLSAGDAISGTGIPADTVIEEITGLTTIKISNATTAAGSAASLLIGDDISGNGENIKYMGISLFYRARRVTVAGVNSDWSDSILAKAGQMQPGYTAANSILANQIVGNYLEVGFANVGYALTIGYSGLGTEANPHNGDRRIRIEEDLIVFEMYDSGWSRENAIRLGGTDQMGRIDKTIRTTAILHPGASDEEALEFMDVPDGDIWTFEGSYSSQTGKTLVPQFEGHLDFTLDPKFGDFSLGNLGSYYSYINVYLTSLYDMTYEKNLCVSFWIKFKNDTPTSDFTLFTFGAGVYSLQIVLTSTGTIFARMVNASDTTAYALNAGWNYVTIYLYNLSETTTRLYLAVNGVYSNTFFTPVAISFETMYFSLPNQDQANALLIDELFIKQDGTVDLTDFVHHYLYDVPWGQYGNPDDVVIKSKEGGRVYIPGDLVLGKQNTSREGLMQIVDNVLTFKGAVAFEAAVTLNTTTTTFQEMVAVYLYATTSVDVYSSTYRWGDLPRSFVYNQSSAGTLYLYNSSAALDVDKHKFFHIFNQSSYNLTIHNYNSSGSYDGGGPDIILEPGQRITFCWIDQTYYIASDGWYKLWSGSTRTVALADCGGFAGEYKIKATAGVYNTITFIEIDTLAQRSLSTPWDGTTYAVGYNYPTDGNNSFMHVNSSGLITAIYLKGGRKHVAAA